MIYDTTSPCSTQLQAFLTISLPPFFRTCLSVDPLCTGAEIRSTFFQSFPCHLKSDIFRKFTCYTFSNILLMSTSPIFGEIFYPFKRQPHKMVKHTQTIRRLLPTNYLSMFGHFVGLALKRLR